MSGSMLSSAALDERRRRILFRAWRRGMREMDLVMGQFADSNLPTMTEAELDEFERLMEAPDPDVLSWITGEAPTPPAYDTPLFARVSAAPREAVRQGERSQVKARRRELSAVDSSAVTDLSTAVRRLGEGGAVTLCRAPEGYDAFVVAELAHAPRRGRREARGRARLRRPRRPARAGLHRRARLRRPGDRGALSALVGLPALRPRVAQRRRRRRADDRARAARPHARRDRAAARAGRSGQRADPARAAAEICRLRRLLRRARQQRADGGPGALARDQRLRPRQHGARRRRLRLARRHPRSLSARRARPDPARLLRRHAGDRSAPSIPRRSAASASSVRSTSCR